MRTMFATLAFVAFATSASAQALNASAAVEECQQTTARGSDARLECSLIIFGIQIAKLGREQTRMNKQLDELHQKFPRAHSALLKPKN